MKTLTNATILAAALAFGSVVALNASEPVGMVQRAAYNHNELMRIKGPRNTALPNFVVAPRVSGKHYAQTLEAYRPASNVKSLDIVHAPRPITAGKDPDFDRKWRENAEAIQIAPLK